MPRYAEMIYNGFWFLARARAAAGAHRQEPGVRHRHGADQALQGQRFGGRPIEPLLPLRPGSRDLRGRCRGLRSSRCGRLHQTQRPAPAHVGQAQPPKRLIGCGFPPKGPGAPKALGVSCCRSAIKRDRQETVTMVGSVSPEPSWSAGAVSSTAPRDAGFLDGPYRDPAVPFRRVAVPQPAPLVGLRAGALPRHAFPEHLARPRLAEGDGWGDTLVERAVAQPARDDLAGRGLAGAFRPVAPRALSPPDPAHDEARKRAARLRPVVPVPHRVACGGNPHRTRAHRGRFDLRGSGSRALGHGAHERSASGRGAAGRLGSRVFRLFGSGSEPSVGFRVGRGCSTPRHCFCPCWLCSASRKPGGRSWIVPISRRRSSVPLRGGS